MHGLTVLVTSLMLFIASEGFAKTINTKSIQVDAFWAGANEAVYETKSTNGLERHWAEAIMEKNVDTEFLKNRIQAWNRKQISSDKSFSKKYSQLSFSTMPVGTEAEEAGPRIALHATRVDVVEDYDDMFNDNIYMYFIVTTGDTVWGRVTSIYSGLDEGESVFLSPEDRGVFGPDGNYLAVDRHLLVDFGMIESDGEDIDQLQRLSGAIVDLALVALSVYSPDAGVAAAQARAETKNLLNLIIALDTDDRLVTDTISFTSQELNQNSSTTFEDFSRFYERETFWTHFAYRAHFRILR